MNVSFTKTPTAAEFLLAEQASDAAIKLVEEFANEVADNHGWPNGKNVQNTKARLLAYIAGLEL